MYQEIHSVLMHSRNRTHSLEHLCSNLYVSVSKYMFILSSQERLAPAEPSGKGGGHSRPQGAVECHQGRKGCTAGAHAKVKG